MPAVERIVEAEDGSEDAAGGPEEDRSFGRVARRHERREERDVAQVVERGGALREIDRVRVGAGIERPRDVEHAGGRGLERARNGGDRLGRRIVEEDAGRHRQRRVVGRARVGEQREERHVAARIHRGPPEELPERAAAGGALSLARHLHRRARWCLPGRDDRLAGPAAGDPAAERDPAVSRRGGPAREARPGEHAAARGGVAGRGDLHLGGRRGARDPGREERDERQREATRVPG